MQVDSIKNTVIVALGVCLVCSILVSTAAVTLYSVQAENKRLDKIKNILLAGDLYQDNASIEEVYNQKIESKVIDLSEGAPLAPEKQTGLLDVETFDIQKVAGDPQYSKAIPQGEDIAGIKRKPEYMPVYLVKEGDRIEKVIMPFYGKGLWSTMYGFIALGSDLKTVRGITYYDHGETPGLGGEVDNPSWKASWKGKNAYDEEGNVIITVLKGKVDPSKPDASHLIDGLSGATITTRGIDNMIKFWLGDKGYGPFLDKLRKEGETNV